MSWTCAYTSSDRLRRCELDHLIVFCAEGAPETAALRALGLVDDSGQTHQGQGTANRRIPFTNAFVELAWVHDAQEAQSALARPTQLWQRWSHRATGSPFGLVFRPGVDQTVESLPFPSWSYRPPYLPAPLAIEVAKDIRPEEPLIFFLPFARRRGSSLEVIEQPAGIATIGKVTLHGPQASPPSQAMELLRKTGHVVTVASSTSLAEVTFTGSRTTALDARPALPLVFQPQ